MKKFVQDANDKFDSSEYSEDVDTVNVPQISELAH